MTHIEKNKVKKSRKIFLFLGMGCAALCVICFITAIPFVPGLFAAVLGITALFSIFSGLIFTTIAGEKLNRLNNYKKELYEKRDDVLLKLIVNLVNEGIRKNGKKIRLTYNILKDNSYRTFVRGYYMATAKLSGDTFIVQEAEKFLAQHIYNIDQ